LKKAGEGLTLDKTVFAVACTLEIILTDRQLKDVLGKQG